MFGCAPKYFKLKLKKKKYFKLSVGLLCKTLSHTGHWSHIQRISEFPHRWDLWLSLDLPACDIHLTAAGVNQYDMGWVAEEPEGKQERNGVSHT